MSHPGYLTRRDKILLAIAILALIPLATVGFPYLAIGVALLLLGALVVQVGKGIWELVAGREPSRRLPARRLNFSKLLRRPMKIRHDRTISTSEPRDPTRM